MIHVYIYFSSGVGSLNRCMEVWYLFLENCIDQILFLLKSGRTNLHAAEFLYNYGVMLMVYVSIILRI